MGEMRVNKHACRLASARKHLRSSILSAEEYHEQWDARISGLFEDWDDYIVMTENEERNYNGALKYGQPILDFVGDIRGWTYLCETVLNHHKKYTTFSIRTKADTWGEARYDNQCILSGWHNNRHALDAGLILEALTSYEMSPAIQQVGEVLQSLKAKRNQDWTAAEAKRWLKDCVESYEGNLERLTETIEEVTKAHALFTTKAEEVAKCLKSDDDEIVRALTDIEHRHRSHFRSAKNDLRWRKNNLERFPEIAEHWVGELTKVGLPTQAETARERAEHLRQRLKEDITIVEPVAHFLEVKG